MKHKILKYGLIFAFFLGIALILYPPVSDYINTRNQSRAVRNYQDTVSEIGDSERAQLLLQAAEYNRRLAQTPGAFYNPDLVTGYLETLDVTGTGIMGYLNIDKIRLELPVYHTVAPEVLQVAVGHLPGTSLPVGGTGSHAVISGHRGLPNARLFSDLNKLEIGDRFTITVLTEVFTYQVDRVTTVEPYEVDDLQISPDEDLCTLFTCTPYGVNTQRLFVRAKRVPNDKLEERRVFYKNEAYRITPALVAPTIAAPVLLILYLVLIVRDRRRQRRNGRGKADAGDGGPDGTKPVS